MKKQIKNQKGFIPIIFIIIGAIAMASATFGVVKYKDEITASVIGIFKKSKIKVPNIDSTSEDKITEEPAIEEKPILEEPKEPEIKKEDNTQQLQEQLRISEQKRLAEEKANANAEKLRAEQEAQKIADEKQTQENQRQRELEKQQAEEKARSANINNIDKELSRMISEIKQRVDIFSQAKIEANNFTSTVRSTMNKYPNSSLIQQTGQQLLDELSNLSFLSGKLFDIDSGRIKTISSFLGSGKIPTANDFSVSTSQYDNYRNQYDLSDAKIKSLMETFVANEKTVLNEMLGQKQEELQRKTKATQTISQLAIIIQGINSQLAILDGQIKEKEAEIEAAKNGLAPMEIINARLAQLTPAYNSLVNQWNSLLATKNKITVVNYKLNDYADYGTLLSAEDRAFLLSLGISF